MTIVPILLLALLVSGATSAPDGLPDPDGSAASPETVEEGKLLYGIYCRNCHGPEGRGDGSAAKHSSPRPPDLTRLSRDNGGRFPTARVLLTIDGRSRVPGQRKDRMPIWGLNLQEPDADTNQEVAVRDKIQCLVAHLKSIQE